jgi:hypothetical protein
LGQDDDDEIDNPLPLEDQVDGEIVRPLDDKAANGGKVDKAWLESQQ